MTKAVTMSSMGALPAAVAILRRGFHDVEEEDEAEVGWSLLAGWEW